MNIPITLTRQPARAPWSTEWLVWERAIALGYAIDNSSALTYNSHLQSYLTFCQNHDLPITPSPNTLSFYTVYMCHHIQPNSVSSYLSGIANSLKPFYPEVRHNRNSQVMLQTLAGCKRMQGTSVTRKHPFSKDDLRILLSAYGTSTRHNDMLFLAIAFTAWHALMRLGKCVDADNVDRRSSRKTVMRNSVTFERNSNTPHYSFHLPAHKADCFFKGNRIVVEKQSSNVDPFRIFEQYLKSRDQLHPFLPQLFIKSNGLVPTRLWFLRGVCLHFSSKYAGQSLRSGGATALTLAGAAPERIQSAGRWSSNTFQIYIQKNPIILQALIGGSATFDQRL